MQGSLCPGVGDRCGAGRTWSTRGFRQLASQATHLGRAGTAWDGRVGRSVLLPAVLAPLGAVVVAGHADGGECAGVVAPAVVGHWGPLASAPPHIVCSSEHGSAWPLPNDIAVEGFWGGQRAHQGTLEAANAVLWCVAEPLQSRLQLHRVGGICGLQTGLHVRLAAPCSAGLHQKQTLLLTSQAKSYISRSRQDCPAAMAGRRILGTSKCNGARLLTQPAAPASHSTCKLCVQLSVSRAKPDKCTRSLCTQCPRGGAAAELSGQLVVLPPDNTQLSAQAAGTARATARWLSFRQVAVMFSSHVQFKHSSVMNQGTSGSKSCTRRSTPSTKNWVSSSPYSSHW